MATIVQTSTFGSDVNFSFTYDDVALKLTGVQATNNGMRPLTIALESPLIATRTVVPGGTLNFNIAAALRPSYQVIDALRSDGTTVQIISGISWRAFLD